MNKSPINSGNVSVKDNPGVDSFEAACTSCRGGYVLDSYDSVWNHPSPTTFKKPSRNIREVIKSSFGSNSSKVYAGACSTYASPAISLLLPLVLAPKQ